MALRVLPEQKYRNAGGHSALCVPARHPPLPCISWPQALTSPRQQALAPCLSRTASVDLDNPGAFERPRRPLPCDAAARPSSTTRVSAADWPTPAQPTASPTRPVSAWGPWTAGTRRTSRRGSEASAVRAGAPGLEEPRVPRGTRPRQLPPPQQRLAAAAVERQRPAAAAVVVARLAAAGGRGGSCAWPPSAAAWRRQLQQRRPPLPPPTRRGGAGTAASGTPGRARALWVPWPLAPIDRARGRSRWGRGPARTPGSVWAPRMPSEPCTRRAAAARSPTGAASLAGKTTTSRLATTEAEETGSAVS